MGFSNPLGLIALLAVPLVAFGLWAATKRRDRQAVRFAAADLLADLAPPAAAWRTWLPAGLLLVAVTFGALAAAAPHLTTSLPREQTELMLVLDNSLSMRATDVSPTRLQAAKDAAVSALKNLPESTKAGVVAFSSSASVLAPPSRDRAQAISAVKTISYGSGTAIGDGIVTALDAFDKNVAGRKQGKAILLMSDGATMTGTPSTEAAAQAKEQGVPIYTVAYGTVGATLQIDGQEVPVDVDEDELKSIAQATGGQYFRALDGATLERIFNEVGSRIGLERTRIDLTGYFVAFAALLGAVAIGLSLWWFGRLA